MSSLPLTRQGLRLEAKADQRHHILSRGAEGIGLQELVGRHQRRDRCALCGHEEDARYGQAESGRHEQPKERDQRKSYMRARFNKNDGHLTLFTRQVGGLRSPHLQVELRPVK